MAVLDLIEEVVTSHALAGCEPLKVSIMTDREASDRNIPMIWKHRTKKRGIQPLLDDDNVAQNHLNHTKSKLRLHIYS